jgi:hypothetical protein
VTAACLGLVFLTQPAASYAQTFCSVRVKVENPYDGRPVRTEVELQEADGKVNWKPTNHEGVAEFCDVGLGLFDIVVGGPVCGRVVIKDWPSTLTMRVLYQNCHYGGLILSGGCKLLLRVQGTQSRPIEQAIVNLDQIRRETDRFGRVFLILPDQRDVVVRIAADGYEPREMVIRCDGKRRQIEETVMLNVGRGRE